MVVGTCSSSSSSSWSTSPRLLLLLLRMGNDDDDNEVDCDRWYATIIGWMTSPVGWKNQCKDLFFFLLLFSLSLFLLNIVIWITLLSDTHQTVTARSCSRRVYDDPQCTKIKQKLYLCRKICFSHIVWQDYRDQTECDVNICVKEEPGFHRNCGWKCSRSLLVDPGRSWSILPLRSPPTSDDDQIDTLHPASPIDRSIQTTQNAINDAILSYNFEYKY